MYGAKAFVSLGTISSKSMSSVIWTVCGVGCYLFRLLRESHKQTRYVLLRYSVANHEIHSLTRQI